MMNVKDFKTLRLSRFLAGAFFCLFLLSFEVSQANGFPLQCESIFHSNSDLLIGMKPQFRGEHEGKYIDPITKKPWQVKYFVGAERRAYELFLKEGRFVDQNGKKAETVFDAEALTFESGLIVVDKNFRIFLMPFEERGKYHHSSLSRGEDIIFAGTAAFSNGILRDFSNSSGHYLPSTQQTLKVLRALRGMGVDLGQMKLRGQVAQELANTPVLTSKELARFLK